MAFGMAQAEAALAAGANPYNSDPTRRQQLGEVMRKYGMLRTLDILGYLLLNDYAHVRGVGLAAVSDVLDAMCKEDIDLTVANVATTFESKRGKDVFRAARKSAFQFHCQPVARSFEQDFQLLERPDAWRSSASWRTSFRTTRYAISLGTGASSS